VISFVRGGGGRVGYERGQGRLVYVPHAMLCCQHPEGSKGRARPVAHKLFLLNADAVWPGIISLLR
jgi:hypothetical protein